MVGGHGKIMPCNENVQVLKKNVQAVKNEDFVAKNAFFALRKVELQTLLVEKCQI